LRSSGARPTRTSTAWSSTRREGQLAEHERAIRLLRRGDLVADGTYRVHSRFRRAVNLSDGRRVLSVVAAGVDAGPATLVVDRLHAGSPETVHVAGSSVTIDGLPVAITDAASYDSTFYVRAADARVVRRNLSVLSLLIAERAPVESLAFLLNPGRVELLRPGFERTYARHMSHCARDIFHGDMLRGVERARGCGFGLTPSGDDLMVGILVAMRFLEQTGGRDLSEVRADVERTARTGSLLGDSFLAFAARGRVCESMRSLVTALALGSSGDVASAFDRISSVGATSGVDAASGLCLGVGAGANGWPRTGRASFGRAAAGAEPVPGDVRAPGEGSILWS